MHSHSDAFSDSVGDLRFSTSSKSYPDPSASQRITVKTDTRQASAHHTRQTSEAISEASTVEFNQTSSESMMLSSSAGRHHVRQNADDIRKQIEQIEAFGILSANDLYDLDTRGSQSITNSDTSPPHVDIDEISQLDFSSVSFSQSSTFGQSSSVSPKSKYEFLTSSSSSTRSSNTTSHFCLNPSWMHNSSRKNSRISESSSVQSEKQLQTSVPGSTPIRSVNHGGQTPHNTIELHLPKDNQAQEEFKVRTTSDQVNCASEFPTPANSEKTRQRHDSMK
jgi:hypothetical protein